MESILTTIKKMLGIEESDTSFDTDIIISINSALMNANQLGVGPENAFFITDSSETWTDFLDSTTNLEAVKTYIYFNVKLMFDPPPHGFLIDSINRQITELAWRLSVQADT